MSADVQVDWSDVERGVRQLADGLARAGPTVGYATAVKVADRIRGGVPVLTGRLRGTVHADHVHDGGAVHYGGTLPYARKIERRTHAVAEGTRGAEAAFYAAMEHAGATEVRKL